MLNGRRHCCTIPALIAIAVYAVSGPAIIVVNSIIIKKHGLHAPGLVSSMGIIFTGASTHILASLGILRVKSIAGEDSSIYYTKILPVGLCNAGNFLLGNWAYEYLDPGFLQMMKAATPALLLFALMVLQVEHISRGVAGFALIMVGGSILAVLHSPHINLLGVMFQGGSQLMEVTQCVLTQVFLQRLAFTAVDAGYYIAPTTGISCLILSAILELPHLLGEAEGRQLLVSQFYWLCASGLVGVAVNYSSFFVIQFISSLMAKLVVVARSMALVIFCNLVFHEAFTRMQLVGYCISLVAFAGYTSLKAQEKQAKVEVADYSEVDNNKEDDDSSIRSDKPLMSGDNDGARE